MILGILYVAFVVLADILAARWIVPLGFGLAAPAGVFMVAPIFSIRDAVHEKYGRKGAYILIGIASVISWLVSAITGDGLLATVTLASVVALVVNESIDTEIYHALKDKNKLLAILFSNAISSLVDSVMFIWIAFVLSGAVPPRVGVSLVIGQYLVKMIISAIVGMIICKKQ